MANAFRSFLEKIGLVAPQTASETKTPAPSTPAPSATIVAPEAPQAPVETEEVYSGEVASTEPNQSTADQTDCACEAKETCDPNTPCEGDDCKCNPTA